MPVAVGGVAREIAATVMRFGEDDVVESRWGRCRTGEPPRASTVVISVSGGVLTSVPLNDRPIAVLAAPTMTGVGMFLDLGFRR